METSATFISTGIAFLQFCGIIHYHGRFTHCAVYVEWEEVHEDQVDAILDISSRFEHCKHFAERQLLIDPNHSDHNSDEET